MKKTLSLLALACLCQLSCKKENLIVTENSAHQEISTNRTEVSKVFAKALTDQTVRDFIKAEALKRFDNDYDVLYHRVKNKLLTDGKTLESKLMEYTSNKELLKETIDNDPLLTFYVPKLEEFSAEQWDTSTDIPIVAVRDLESKKKHTNEPLIAYDARANTIKLSYYEQPTVPVIVVKSNERIILETQKEKKSTSGTSKASLKSRVKQIENGSLNFLDDSFDNTSASKLGDKKNNANQQKQMRSTALKSSSTYGYPAANGKHQAFFNFLNDQQLNNNVANYIDSQKLLAASEKTYQRDYIYYDIVNPTDKGEYNDSHVEAIHSISFNQNSSHGYVVDDHRDWTDGILEIKVHVTFLKRTGGLESIYKIFSVSADELFKKEQNVNKPRVYYLPEPIPLIGWNMYETGSMWHFFVEEVDPGSETTKTVQVSSNFSKSWEIGGNVGVDIWILKIGVSGKGQGSSSETKTETMNYKVTGTSDDLGVGVLEYGDKVSLGYQFDISPWHEAHNIYTVNTGMVELGIVPKLKY